jgi:hypothetical protein
MYLQELELAATNDLLSGTQFQIFLDRCTNPAHFTL